ncbi:fluoride efflux transporter FluC [Nocardioides yefusunii]|uniref:Fluoride-specific ion channel FluC n=1 Tax=Nocardioides yefusunii TaxID=2500546 RepID=A0ABW1QXI9_9ACTN|nr:CrcB family protein [Nocardioides yefusunii]
MKPLGTKDALTLAAAGGALGTFCRWLMASVLGDASGLSAGIVMANVIGAGLLGYVTARLGSSRLDPARVRRLQVFLGTGVLGGFTTYSTLAVHGAQLVEAGDVLTAIWQVGAQIVLGVCAAVVGLLVGDRDLMPQVEASLGGGRGGRDPRVRQDGER